MSARIARLANRVEQIEGRLREFGSGGGIAQELGFACLLQQSAAGNGCNRLQSALKADLSCNGTAEGSTDRRFDALIARAAAEHGIDPDLIRAVIQAESDYNPLCVSSAGAKGLMQLMPGTARYLGVTDVFEPAQNIEAGTRYLKQQLDRFGDTVLALAAYNAGPGAVEQYGGVPPYRETQAYVRRVVRDYRARAARQATAGDQAAAGSMPVALAAVPVVASSALQSQPPADDTPRLSSISAADTDSISAATQQQAHRSSPLLAFSGFVGPNWATGDIAAATLAQVSPGAATRQDEHAPVAERPATDAVPITRLAEQLAKPAVAPDSVVAEAVGTENVIVDATYARVSGMTVAQTADSGMEAVGAATQASENSPSTREPVAEVVRTGTVWLSSLQSPVAVDDGLILNTRQASTLVPYGTEIASASSRIGDETTPQAHMGQARVIEHTVEPATAGGTRTAAYADEVAALSVAASAIEGAQDVPLLPGVVRTRADKDPGAVVSSHVEGTETAGAGPVRMESALMFADARNGNGDVDDGSDQGLVKVARAPGSEGVQVATGPAPGQPPNLIVQVTDAIKECLGGVALTGTAAAGGRPAVASERQYISMALSPPELGDVHISLDIQQDAASVEVRAERFGTAVHLDNSFRTLSDSFHDLGLKLVSLKVGCNTSGDFAQGQNSAHAWSGEGNAPGRLPLPEVAEAQTSTTTDRWPSRSGAENTGRRSYAVSVVDMAA